MAWSILYNKIMEKQRKIFLYGKKKPPPDVSYRYIGKRLLI